jgi:hypothetical protein
MERKNDASAGLHVGTWVFNEEPKSGERQFPSAGRGMLKSGA